MYSILEHEERLRIITRSKEERIEVMALAAQAGARIKRREKRTDLSARIATNLVMMK